MDQEKLKEIEKNYILATQEPYYHAQYVQIPSEICKKVKNKENLVYAVIRMHMNKDTKEAFPSIKLICEKTGLSDKTVMNAIKSLKDDGHIFVTKRGRSNIYTFKSFNKNYERFTFEFINKLELTPELKSYIMGSFPSSFKDSELAISTISDRKIMEDFGISPKTITRYDTELSKQNIMTKINTRVRDTETGLMNHARAIDMAMVCQAVLYVNEKTDKNTDEINKLRDEIKRLRNLIEGKNE